MAGGHARAHAVQQTFARARAGANAGLDPSTARAQAGALSTSRLCILDSQGPASKLAQARLLRTDRPGPGQHRAESFTGPSPARPGPEQSRVVSGQDSPWRSHGRAAREGRGVEHSGAQGSHGRSVLRRVERSCARAGAGPRCRSTPAGVLFRPYSCRPVVTPCE